MLDDNFAKWLQKDKNMGVKSARDVISRCRRIQLVFKISLDKEVKNSKDAEELVLRIKKDENKILKPGTVAVSAIFVIIRAIRLYGEYRELK